MINGITKISEGDIYLFSCICEGLMPYGLLGVNHFIVLLN
jgi:hypothetical protein